MTLNFSMKFILSFPAIIIFAFFISCASSKSKKEAEAKALEFFTNLKNGDEKKLEALYPHFREFESYYKSDSARINSVVEKDRTLTVSVYNRFTNAYGKTTEKHISLM